MSHPIEQILGKGENQQLALSQALPLWLNTSLFVTDNLDSQDNVQIAWANLEPATPVIVSAKVVPWSRTPTRQSPLTSAEIDTIALHMSVAAEGFSCEAIPVLDLPEATDRETTPSVQVLGHRAWNQRIELEIEVTEDCFARLAYSWHPSLEVWVDGERTIPLKTVGHFIALPLEQGTHLIILRPVLSPLRFALLCVTLMLVTGATGLYLYKTFWQKRAGEK